MLILLLFLCIYYAQKQHITRHNYKDRKKQQKLRAKMHIKLETTKQITKRMCVLFLFTYAFIARNRNFSANRDYHKEGGKEEVEECEEEEA